MKLRISPRPPSLRSPSLPQSPSLSQPTLRSTACSIREERRRYPAPHIAPRIRAALRCASKPPPSASHLTLPLSLPLTLPLISSLVLSVTLSRIPCPSPYPSPCPSPCLLFYLKLQQQSVAPLATSFTHPPSASTPQVPPWSQLSCPQPTTTRLSSW